MKIVVCWKWVSLDGEYEADPRWSGVSAADKAALEVALGLADSSGNAEEAAGPSVVVVCLGPAAADDVLREALAVGADDVVRIDAASHLDSREVAGALAAAMNQVADGADLVLCGDYSMDRGTGSVPGYLAAELGIAQALGLLDVRRSTDADVLRVTRRLDGGRREILDVSAPAVLSVEGSVARLRRASIGAELTTRRATITSIPGPHGHPLEAEIQPYRPRARALPAPVGDSLDRMRQILDVGGDDVHAELVELEPAAAAARIVQQLRDWGYLTAPATG